MLTPYQYARSEYDPTQPLPADVKTLTNQLAHISDSDPAGNYAVDIDNQDPGNYDYDNIGNLIRDNAESITGIEWNVSGKIKQIVKNGVTINYQQMRLHNAFVFYSRCSCNILHFEHFGFSCVKLRVGCEKNGIVPGGFKFLTQHLNY